MCFFPVLNPYRLVISFIALIHIACCVKLHFHQAIQMGFVFHIHGFCFHQTIQMGFVFHTHGFCFHQTVQMGFVLNMFQDKCNRDCHRDNFQCYRNRLHNYFFIRNRNRGGGK